MSGERLNLTQVSFVYLSFRSSIQFHSLWETIDSNPIFIRVLKVSNRRKIHPIINRNIMIPGMNCYFIVPRKIGKTKNVMQGKLIAVVYTLRTY